MMQALKRRIAMKIQIFKWSLLDLSTHKPSKKSDKWLHDSSDVQAYLQ